MKHRTGINMLKTCLGVSFFALAVSSQAQSAPPATPSAPTPVQMNAFAAQAKTAQTILAAGIPEGKVDSPTISYVNDTSQWICAVVIKVDKSDEFATASSPERACVQLLIKLAHRGVI